ncbi:UNVERIFIED_CONTAM: hypothetical protein PYX00_002299 [Menopon gallinae]|uniref:Immunoglobulin-binding protein 1 n=1 Tax=Menopon gallinae TaxID=328185 RepID=A0AAW2IHK2_9NEOP
MESVFNDSEDGNRTLSEMFDDAMDVYESINKSEEETSSSNYQMNVRKCISLCEKATNLINLAGLFSSNETIEEIPSENLKYLLLPALLGSLVLKLQSSDRLNNLETAEIYFKDFIKRLQDYEMIKQERIPVLEEENEDAPRKQMNLDDLARERNEKIRKYKEQKELEKELDRLKSLMKNCDDETCRQYYLTCLKSYMNKALEEINCIRQEKPLAKHLAEVREGKTYVSTEAKDHLQNKYIVKPLRPVIITRNEIQKKVFGAGYPSLPTMTVDEFYRERVAEGIFPAQGSSYSKTLQELSDPEVAKKEEEKEEIRKEREVECDDADYLNKARQMDDFKDDHRRGWGNTMNRS